MGYRVENATRTWKRYWVRFICVTGVLALLVAVGGVLKPTAYAQSGDWPTYMQNVGRSGFNGAETIINPTSAPNLKLHWKHKAGGRVTTQPVEANGLVYWGSWDGLEHATNPSTGADVWTANLGQSSSSCLPIGHGVLSTAAIVSSVSIGGVLTTVDFVGGGDTNLYALNANTGAVIWHTSLGSAPDHFLYSSPVVYKGSVYIGVASFNDCPLVQGQLVQLKASTGAIQHRFNVVPSGCLGGGVWGSPTVDNTTDTIYFATGNQGSCSTTETMAPALVELHTADLSFVASWLVPPSQQQNDGDFGSTPTLFTATIGGTSHQMVGLENKNGIYYAFDRTNIAAGPLWQVKLAAHSSSGKNISSSAWDGTTLYVAAGSTTINGTTCASSLRALNPSTGAFLWQDCLAAIVYGPVTAVPGLAEVGSGTSIIIVGTANGNQLFSFQDTNSKSNFQGPGSISHGVLYHGNVDGYLYAIGT